MRYLLILVIYTGVYGTIQYSPIEEFYLSMVWYSEVLYWCRTLIMTNLKVKIISFIIQKLNIRISRMYKILLNICELSDGQQLVLGWELLRMISKQNGTVPVPYGTELYSIIWIQWRAWCTIHMESWIFPVHLCMVHYDMGNCFKKRKSIKQKCL